EPLEVGVVERLDQLLAADKQAAGFLRRRFGYLAFALDEAAGDYEQRRSEWIEAVMEISHRIGLDDEPLILITLGLANLSAQTRMVAAVRPVYDQRRARWGIELVWRTAETLPLASEPMKRTLENLSELVRSQGQNSTLLAEAGSERYTVSM